ncbi:hypothetical protein CVT26_001302, partial [Gymnopilus dilepis]
SQAGVQILARPQGDIGQTRAKSKVQNLFHEKIVDEGERGKNAPPPVMPHSCGRCRARVRITSALRHASITFPSPSAQPTEATVSASVLPAMDENVQNSPCKASKFVDRLPTNWVELH